jgi:hypothetical protein
MRRRCARILPTTVVGSYPQPNWLIDRKLLGTMVPGVGMPEMWRVPAPWLEQVQDDATLLAARDMERAGIDLVTDGEMRRESYSNRFATALEGVDIDHPATITGRAGKPSRVPRSTRGPAPAPRRGVRLVAVPHQQIKNLIERCGADAKAAGFTGLPPQKQPPSP